MDGGHAGMLTGGRACPNLPSDSLASCARDPEAGHLRGLRIRRKSRANPARKIGVPSPGLAVRPTVQLQPAWCSCVVPIALSPWASGRAPLLVPAPPSRLPPEPARLLAPPEPPTPLEPTEVPPEAALPPRLVLPPEAALPPRLVLPPEAVLPPALVVPPEA